MIDDEFDETVDLPEPTPKQELAKPHLLINVPEPDLAADDGEFDVDGIQSPPEPREDWRESLDKIEYDPTAVEITEVDIAVG